MEAGAAIRALHAAVTGKEVTTHAQRKAVGLIFTQKLIRLYLHNGLRLWSTISPTNKLVGMPAVEATPHVVNVHDPWVMALVSSLVDLLQPFHLAVTKEGIVAEKELWDRF